MNQSLKPFPIIFSLILFTLFADACSPNNPDNINNQTEIAAPTQPNTPDAAMSDESAKDENAAVPLADKPDVAQISDDKTSPANSDIPVVADNSEQPPADAGDQPIAVDSEQPVTDNGKQPVNSNRPSPKFIKYLPCDGCVGGLKCETTLKYHDKTVYVSKAFELNKHRHTTDDEAIELLLQKGCKRVCDEILKNASEDCIKDCSETASFDSAIQCFSMKSPPPKNLI